MGRSRKYKRGGVTTVPTIPQYELTEEDRNNILRQVPPYKPSPAPSPAPPLSPEAIIESHKPGVFTDPIPGIRSTLTWAELRDLSTTQLTEAEATGVSDPHELFRSLVGADGNRLLTALRGALNDDDVLPVERTNEIQGLLSGWMDVRRGLGLPPILDPAGREITVARLNPLSCRISNRPDLAEYSDKWNVVASFVEARPPIFKAVFAEVFIPTTITGGSEGGMGCLEGFCDYAFIEMRNAVIRCFASEDRAQPTVLPPVTGVLKMSRGRTTVSRFLETVAPVEGALTIEPYRDQIMRLLQETYRGVVWTDNDITTIFNELRMIRDAYLGGKTRRKRKRRKTKRRILN